MNHRDATNLRDDLDLRFV